MILNEDFFDDIDTEDIVNSDIEENDQQFNRRISLELNTHYYEKNEDGTDAKPADHPIHMFPKYFYRILPTILNTTIGINSWGKVRYGFQDDEEKYWIKKLDIKHNIENVDYYGSDEYEYYDENKKFVNFSINSDFRTVEQVSRFLKKLFSLKYKNIKVIESISVTEYDGADSGELFGMRPRTYNSIKERLKNNGLYNFYRGMLNIGHALEIPDKLTQNGFDEMIYDMFCTTKIAKFRDNVIVDYDRIPSFYIYSCFVDRNQLYCNDVNGTFDDCVVNEFSELNQKRMYDSFISFYKKKKNYVKSNVYLVGNDSVVGVIAVWKETFIFDNVEYMIIMIDREEGNSSDNGETTVKFIKGLSDIFDCSVSDFLKYYNSEWNLLPWKVVDKLSVL